MADINENLPFRESMMPYSTNRNGVTAIRMADPMPSSPHTEEIFFKSEYGQLARSLKAGRLSAKGAEEQAAFLKKLALNQGYALLR